MFSATEDILVGSSLPTSLFLLICQFPVLITKVCVSWFFQEIFYDIKVSVATVLSMLGLLVLGLGTSVYVRLAGAMAVAIMETTFLALSSHYHKITVTAFSAGFGVSALITSLFYSGLTIWTCLSPRDVILVSMPLPILFIPFYVILKKKPSYKSFRFRDENYRLVPMEEDTDDQETELSKPLSSLRKVSFFLTNMTFICYLVLSYFSKTLLLQGVTTTRTFSNSNFAPSDYFQWYSLSNRLGKFLGRTYPTFFIWVPSHLQVKLCTEKVGALAFISVAHLLLLMLDAWYHFIPYLLIIFTLCTTQGFIHGALYINTGRTISGKFEGHPRKEKEFALSMVTVGSNLGVISAGLLGLFEEPYIKYHCLYELKLGKYCFTRAPKASSWLKNIHCENG